nr:gas vesicle protein K [Petropleomorpha daqingensis]
MPGRHRPGAAGPAAAAHGHPAARRGAAVSAPRRLAGSGEDVGRGLGRLVVTLLEVVRQVVERQALRRVEVGDLSDEQIERLGQALLQLEATFDELIEHFGVVPNDVYLPLDLAGLDRLAAPTRRTP